MRHKKAKDAEQFNNSALAFSESGNNPRYTHENKDYYEFVELLPEIIFELDTEAKITYINKRATDLLGYSKDELIGKPAVDFVISAERMRAERGIKNTIAGQEYTAVDYFFLKKDGSHLPFLLYTSPIYHSGEAAGARGIAVDATSHLRAEKALKESKTLFNIIAEQTIVGIAIFQEGKLIFVNDYFSKLVNHSVGALKELNTKSLLKHVHKEDKEKVIEYFINLLARENKYTNNIQYRVTDRDGKVRWLDIWSQVVTYMGEESIFTFGVDITEHKDIERVLKEREDRFHALMENSTEVIGIFDGEGNLKYGSQSITRMLGYRPQELSGTSFFDVVHPDDHTRLSNLFLDLKEGVIKKINIEFRCKHNDGSWRFIATTANNLLDDPSISGIVINLRDVTERKEAEERAVYYEFHDSLTGLPNREMFMSRLEIEIQQAQAYRRKNDKDSYIFAVMCLGLDRFKNINDIYSPAVGDILLQKIGARLKKNFRENDLVARYGGDTYMILFSSIESYDDVVDIIQKTLDIFSDPYVIDENIFKITASIGVCLYPHDGYNKETILKNSESAMYMAKEHGRNTYRLYDAQMNAELLTRLQLEKELEHAIMHNNFKAYYQPKVDVKGRIVGIESLIRWISSKDGKIILPSYFIEVAEKNGAIVDLGNIMLYEACSQNKKWQDMGYARIRVAVNISPSQFIQPNLVPNIKNILKQTGLDAKYLELELTESGIMENEEDSIKKLQELHDMGVKITIDDFGTGYSSLSKLKDYPIDTLKIDRSFTENLPENEKSSTITTTIIDLAHNLGFRVIAEGVETKEQLKFLHKHKCDHYQGFLFSRPLPADKIEKKLREQVIVSE